jgi:O-antigen/teichoic acid export membrane protein
VGILRGTLEGQQLFGRANALRSLFGVLSFAAPIAVLPFSVSLPALITAIAIGRYLSLIAYVIVVRRAWPTSETPADGVAPDRTNTLARMLREGAWLSVSNLVGPIMVTFDRLAIAHLLSLAAAAYYLVPQEIALRVLVIPAAVATTIFPMLSHAEQPIERHARISRDGLLAVACLSLPVCIALALFAPFLLSVWMGVDFARASGPVAAVIAVGLFANCCSQAPFAWIQAGGRSDITGKLHLLQLPIYIALLYAATIEMGIVGAAVVWSARALADYALLLLASARLFPHLRAVVATATKHTWIGVTLLVAIVASHVIGASLWITGAFALAGLFVALRVAMPLLEDRRR